MDLANPDGASARFGVSLASVEKIDDDEHADFADHAIGSNAGVRRPERSARLRHALRRRAPLASMRSPRSGNSMP